MAWNPYARANNLFTGPTVPYDPMRYPGVVSVDIAGNPIGGPLGYGGDLYTDQFMPNMGDRIDPETGQWRAGEFVTPGAQGVPAAGSYTASPYPHPPESSVGGGGAGFSFSEMLGNMFRSPGALALATGDPRAFSGAFAQGMQLEQQREQMAQEQAYRAQQTARQQQADALAMAKYEMDVAKFQAAQAAAAREAAARAGLTPEEQQVYDLTGGLPSAETPSDLEQIVEAQHGPQWRSNPEAVQDFITLRQSGAQTIVLDSAKDTDVFRNSPMGATTAEKYRMPDGSIPNPMLSEYDAIMMGAKAVTGAEGKVEDTEALRANIDDTMTRPAVAEAYRQYQSLSLQQRLNPLSRDAEIAEKSLRSLAFAIAKRGSPSAEPNQATEDAILATMPRMLGPRSGNWPEEMRQWLIGRGINPEEFGFGPSPQGARAGRGTRPQSGAVKPWERTDLEAADEGTGRPDT